MNSAYDRIPTGSIKVIPMMHSGYDPAQQGHRDFPSLGAMHGYATNDPEFFEKLGRDILAVESEVS
jgi:hypothetical protein